MLRSCFWVFFPFIQVRCLNANGGEKEKKDTGELKKGMKNFSITIFTP